MFVITDKFYRALEQKELDTLFLCMVNLFDPGRHFCFRTPVNNVGMFSAQAFCCSYGIHCGIASAEHGNAFALALEDRSVTFREVISFHEVDPCQELVCRQHADQVFPGYSHEPRKTSSNAYECGIESLFLDQFIDGDRASHDNV